MSLLGGMVGAMSGVGASLVNNVAGMFGYRTDAEKQNQFNADEAQRSRDWQTYMASNRYTMQADDLRRAGLNPMLAYTQGAMGVPGGATAQSTSTSDTANATHAFTAGSAHQLRRETAENMQAQNVLMGAQSDAETAKARMYDSHTARNAEETLNAAFLRKYLETVSRYFNDRIESNRVERGKWRTESDLNTENTKLANQRAWHEYYGNKLLQERASNAKILAYIELAERGTGIAKNLANAFADLKGMKLHAERNEIEREKVNIQREESEFYRNQSKQQRRTTQFNYGPGGKHRSTTKTYYDQD